MIIDSIRNFIRKCPCLQNFNGAIKVNVNYLEENSTVYSIEEIPSEPILKRYADGSTIRQYQFTFCSREPYGPSVIQNIQNSGFYEDFAEWIEEENSKGNLPILEGKCEALEIKTLSNGYAFQVDVDKARYQIDLILKYYKGV